MWMLRNDGTDVPDTVATALYESYEPQNNYTELILDIEYRNEYEPEILNIMAVSSNPDDPIAESVLYIDKIELDYNTGIIDETFSDFQVYPNPTSDFIMLNDRFINCNYYISDLNGNKLIQNQYNQLINISNLIEGTYIISVEYYDIIHSQKFIKQ